MVALLVNEESATASCSGYLQSCLQKQNSFLCMLLFTFTFHFHALEKEMATHSSVLAWRIPGTGSLVGCRLWGCTESETTEAMQQQLLLVDMIVSRNCHLLLSPTSAHSPFLLTASWVSQSE